MSDVVIDGEGLLERFCRYVTVDTTSSRHAGTVPSTEGQRTLAGILAKELHSMGAQSVEVDAHAFVIAHFAASSGARNTKGIGLMSHLDTVSDVPGANVKPLVHRGYEGGRIALRDGAVLDPAEFPDLAAHAGDTIITSDGTTLLGADDKAGIAIIMSALENLASQTNRPRCPLHILFTPDEEIGRGMDFFPIEKFPGTACYTVDGGEEGHVEAECFEAYRALVVFTGKSIHPGTARGKLVNAVEMAGRFLTQLPGSESPQATDGRFGFYLPLEITGGVEKAELEVYIRDFQDEACLRRIEALRAFAASVQTAFPGGVVSLETEKQYANMRRRIAESPEVLDLLQKAIGMTGLTVTEKPIRGGTDGSRLTAMGIPTPNIFTGGYNYHSRLEWASLPGMTKAAETLVHLAGLWAARE